MAEETQTEAAEATGMAALGALTEDAAAPAVAEAPAAPAEPKIDNLGRSYATGLPQGRRGPRLGQAGYRPDEDQWP